MPEPTRQRTRTTRKKAKKPKEITFHKFVRSLPRPYPDPYTEWHIGLYDAATTLKRKLEGLTHKPLLSDKDLLKLGVVRGAELIIDDDNPIDLERRFFKPGSSDEAAQCVQSYNENEKWPKPCTDSTHAMNWRGYQIEFPYIQDIKEIVYACWVLVEWKNRYSLREERYTHRGNPNWAEPFTFRKTNFYHFKLDFISQGCPHRFLLYKWLANRPLSDSDYTKSEVSHTMAMVADTIKPDDRILRSEVLTAAMLIRENLAQRFWPGHYTLPVLMFSFHATSCRLLQLHFENGRFHIRASRSLSLVSNDGTVPSGAQLIARWLMAESIGETRFSEVPCTKFEADDLHEPQNPGAPCTLALANT